MSYFLVRPDVGRYQPWSAEIYLRSQVARDHAVTHTFSYLSMPLQATNWVPVICGWLRRAFFKACPPAACTIARPDLPARLGTPADCEALPFAGGPSGPYLSGCARQLLTVRCAHYAGGASLTTFGFVTIVPRYLLPQVMPSHSFAALTALVVRRVKGDVALPMYRVSGLGDQPKLACTSRRATPKGVERTLGSGTLPPAHPRRDIGVRTRQRHLAA